MQKNQEPLLTNLILKELYKVNDFSFNLGFNFDYVGGSIGYTPPVLNKTFEAHLGVFNSWSDTFDLKFNPKIGIGVSIKF